MRSSLPVAGIVSAALALAVAAAPAFAARPLCPSPSFESEPNDVTGTADILGTPCYAYRGAIVPANDADFYRMNLISGIRVWLLVDTGEPPDQNFDTDATLQLLAPDGTTVIEVDDDDGCGNGGDGTLESSFAPAIAGRQVSELGNYFIRVRNFDADQITQYHFGTMATFVFNDRPEKEPNGTPATATPAWMSPQVRLGNLSPAGESDFHRVHARAGEMLFVAADGNPERDASNTDVDLELRAADGTTVLFAATNATSGDGMGAEAFRYNVTSSGVYYVRAFGHTAGTTGTYDLMIAGGTELFLDGFESGTTEEW